jgi:hypothetical protein
VPAGHAAAVGAAATLIQLPTVMTLMAMIARSIVLPFGKSEQNLTPMTTQDTVNREICELSVVPTEMATEGNH